MHNKLKNRNKRWSKTIEVALGCNESWYVKYADGTYDYALPPHVADSFEDHRKKGWKMMNVALNSENGDWLLRFCAP